MHVLAIILIVLLAIIAVFLGIVVYVLLSAFFAVQPILTQLGKISMVVEFVRFVARRIHRRYKRRHSHLDDE